MVGVPAVLEIAVHPEFHQLVANTPKQELERPVQRQRPIMAFEKYSPLNHPHDPEGDEDEVPGPEDQIDLVNDDIECEDAERVEIGLTPRRPVLIVVAAGHLGSGSKQNDIQDIEPLLPEGKPRTSDCSARPACSPPAVS